MSTLRQFLGAILAGLAVVALIAGSLVLSSNDAAIAFLPTSTLAPGTSTPSATPVPPTRTATGTPTRTPTLFPTSTCPRPPGWIDYVVQSGDDLASVAARFGIDAVTLQVNNCLNEPTIEPGQNLFVPPLPTPTATATFVQAPTQAPCGPPLTWVRYIVRPGDTLSSLARATGTTVEQIRFANCLVGDVIRAGEVLWLPRLPFPTPTRTPFPTFTPTPTGTASPSATVSSATPTPSPTPGAPITNTPTDTPTQVPTTPVPSETPSETPVVIQTPTPSPTIDATATSSPTFPPPSDTPTLSATP